MTIIELDQSDIAAGLGQVCRQIDPDPADGVRILFTLPVADRKYLPSGNVAGRVRLRTGTVSGVAFMID